MRTHPGRLFFASDNYYIDTGAIPAALDYLTSNAAGIEGWDGPYADATDLVDPWGRLYVYDDQPPADQIYAVALADDRHYCAYVHP